MEDYKDVLECQDELVFDFFHCIEQQDTVPMLMLENYKPSLFDIFLYYLCNFSIWSFIGLLVIFSVLIVL